MKLLVVDDDAMVLKSTVRHLQSHFDCQAVGTVQEAIQALQGVDMVLSDYSMPDGGGRAVLEAAEHHSKPLVFYSGDDVNYKWVARKGDPIERLIDLLYHAKQSITGCCREVTRP